MKRTLILLATFSAISACTATPQMIESQKAKCSQIGYAPGSPDFLACVERGAQMGEAGMTAAASSAASSAITLGVINALF